ncbi:hypothetical protein Thiowin_03637 [Thiorhodovibrio winogradskyi]|uniref:AAA domain-containing protein n=1 Tax=Thiorhodovibrio winogradskyi TaxID=77007 RepID=A0ABZ0SC05_9GAMM
MDEILTLIERKKYFLLHAPRQTGKTTCLLALMEYLNREGRYRALHANIEAAREQIEPAMATICGVLGRAARRHLGDAGLLQWSEQRTPQLPAGDRLGANSTLALKPGAPVIDEQLDGFDEVGLMLAAINGAVHQDARIGGISRLAGQGPGQGVGATRQGEAQPVANALTPHAKLAPEAVDVTLFTVPPEHPVDGRAPGSQLGAAQALLQRLGC